MKPGVTCTLVMGILFFLLTSSRTIDDKEGTIKLKKRCLVSVEALAMNVLYIGVDNPLAIASLDHQKISSITILNGSLTRQANGYYVARVNHGNQTEILIYTTSANGKQKLLDTKIFRVKRVPDPAAKFAGVKGSAAVLKTTLLSAMGVIAELENFDFDLAFEIIGFDVTANICGFEKSCSSNTNKVNSSQLEILKAVKKGGKVYIENIKAKGPDGSIRALGPINIKVL